MGEALHVIVLALLGQGSLNMALTQGVSSRCRAGPRWSHGGEHWRLSVLLMSLRSEASPHRRAYRPAFLDASMSLPRNLSRRLAWLLLKVRMKPMLSALYAVAQQDGASPDQLERYYARLRLAELARTRPPCPHCFSGDGSGGHLRSTKALTPCIAAGVARTFGCGWSAAGCPGGPPRWTDR